MAEYDGIVRDGSKRDYVLPPMGMELTPEDRALFVENYGEKVVQDWERRNAMFMSGEGESNGGLTEEEEATLLRDLGYDV